MNLPPLSNWFSLVLAGSCFIGIPALLFISWLISNVVDNRMQEKREAQNNALRKRGVTALAVVVSARKGMARSPFGRKEIRIDYEVDVQPERGTPFRQSFQYWTERRGYTAIAGQLVGEQGRKIWVTYDPNDSSQMIFEHDDKEHEKIVKEKEVDARRAEFNKLTEGNEELKKNGEQAEAVITRVDDLNLPYPLKGSRAMHLWFDVTSKTGLVFQAEANVLIVEASLQKYSVGRKVYVRFDPRQQQRAVLDTERNKSIK
jgi:hypothetical protein